MLVLRCWKENCQISSSKNTQFSTHPLRYMTTTQDITDSMNTCRIASARVCFASWCDSDAFCVRCRDHGSHQWVVSERRLLLVSRAIGSLLTKLMVSMPIGGWTEPTLSFSMQKIIYIVMWRLSVRHCTYHNALHDSKYAHNTCKIHIELLALAH